jgi:hypothetical protein
MVDSILHADRPNRDADRPNPVVFCAPVALAATGPAGSLEGAEILVSDLELHLLQHLDLLPWLKESLGRDGKLVLFEDTRARILQDAADLKHTAPREPLRRYENLAMLVARLPKIQLDTAAGEAWLVHDGEASSSMPRMSLRTVAQRLFDEGRIDDRQRGCLLADLPELPVQPWPDPPPERLLLSGMTLVLLSGADALPATLEAFPGRLLVEPETETSVHHTRTHLAHEVQSADQAQAVEEFVSRGVGTWIRLATAPETRALPPLQEQGELSGETQAQLVLRPLQRNLTVRSLMHRDKHLRRLTADLFGSSLLGHPDQIRRIAWPDEESYRALSRWNREIATRDLHLPALVRMLLDSPRRDDKLLKLAELGFPDALDGAELIRLDRRYGGLAKAEPRRLLDCMEWMAREREHVGGDMARLRLARVYADAIWLAFCGGEGDEAPTSAARVLGAPKPEVQAKVPQLDEADAAALASELLRRVEEIDAKVDSASLDLLLLYVGLEACSRPLAFVRRQEGMAVVDEEGRGARLWRFLYETWASGNPGRRAALGRAVQETLCALDQMRPTGPTLAETTPFFLVMGDELQQGRNGLRISLEQPEIEACAILSAHWKDRPLGKIKMERRVPTHDSGKLRSFYLEEVLVHGAGILGRSDEIHGDARSREFPFPLDSSSSPVWIRAPLESLLLRAEPEMLAEVARHWARWQGPHDGRAHALLIQIAARPQDLGLRRAYARLTSIAPWRLVREDPAFLLRWPQRRGAGGSGPTLTDLRAMLSEPEGPLPAEPLGDHLHARVAPGGVWADRFDIRELFFQASEVPGSLPVATIGSRLAPDVYAQEVEAALDRIDHPEDHPVARLGGALYFLRFAAVHQPRVRLPAGEIDLSRELPERVARLLGRFIEPLRAGTPADTSAAGDVSAPGVVDLHHPGTMADVEGALLRACQRVVSRLSGAARLARRDLLWLTYRLFQWLCTQLDALGAEDRRAGMRRLSEAAPPAVERAADLLDPSHFDRSYFDHRLATVLYALVAMEELPRHAGVQGQAPEAPPHAISSAVLEDKLVELASRPRKGLSLRSELEWNASAEIPDLAFVALLKRNPDALLMLSPAVRLQRIQELPEAPEALTGWQRSLAQGIVFSAADSAAQLGPAERAALEAKLRGMDESPTGRQLRWVGLSSLFGPSAPHLEGEARELLLEHLEDSMAPIGCGRFLSAIGALDPGRLEGEVEVLLPRASERGEVGAGVILVGVGRVALAGPVEARMPARELLGKLAARAPFNEDPNVRQMLRFLRIPEPS